jgi:hypothetical protein
VSSSQPTKGKDRECTLTPPPFSAGPLQVHNSTELPIDVGVQTPMGLVMEPQPLGSVLPGKSLWLPVLRAEAGLLCIRPSAGAAAHALLTTLPDTVAAPSTAATFPALTVDTGRGPGTPSALLSPTPHRPGIVHELHAAVGAPQFPTSHPGLLYASGRLSPARGNLDRAVLQQLEAAAQHDQRGDGSGHSSHSVSGTLQGCRHDWSTAVQLQQLLRQPGGAEGGPGPAAGDVLRPTRQLVCHPAMGSGEDLPVIFTLGTSPSGGNM